jgi:hypothetical protein
MPIPSRVHGNHIVVVAVVVTVVGLVNVAHHAGAGHGAEQASKPGQFWQLFMAPTLSQPSLQLLP